jgi:hypothetical protein
MKPDRKAGLEPRTARRIGPSQRAWGAPFRTRCIKAPQPDTHEEDGH